jgi:hypothetical protein
MGTELYINGFLVDLDQNPVFPLTFSVIELTDLSKRSGAKSKTITLPGTSRNCALLNSIFVLDNAQAISANQSNYIDFDPTIKATGVVYQNGLLQFNGIAQLLSCIYSNNSWSFEVALISDMRDYIAEMSKVKLNELDFSEYQHILNIANVQQTWNGFNQINGSTTPINSGGIWDQNAGYYYGLIEYGYDRVNQFTWALNQLPLQIFCYQILKKLFTKVGLTWNSNFLESDLFRRCALAYQGGDIPTISPAQADNDSAYLSEIPNSNGFIINGQTQLGVNTYNDQGGLYYIFSFGTATFTDQIDATVNQDNLGQIISGSPLKFKCLSEGLYNINYKGRHIIDLNFNLNAGTLLGPLNGYFKLFVNVYKNGALYSQESVYEGPITSPALTQSFTVDFDHTRAINALVNDEFTIYIRFVVYLGGVDISGLNPNGTESYNVSVSTIDTNVDFAKQIQELTAGASVYLSALLPDMTGSDFFNGICKMFNLLVSPSKTDPKILEIEPLIEYYKSSNEALQWTQKIDESKEIEVIPSINFASKNYSFRFADSDDYYNVLYFNNFGEQYGSFLLEAQNEYGKDNTVYQLPFAQKVLANIPIDDTTFTNLITPQCWVIGSDGNVSPKQGKPFIVQVGNLTTGSFRIINESGGSSSFSMYPYVGHMDNINFPDFDLNFGVPKVLYWSGAQFTQNNLYPYHEQFIKEIISRFGKLLKCYINLNSTDIFTLDFQSLINLGGVVYRLQKISDYNTSNDESTKVELLKYIN